MKTLNRFILEKLKLNKNIQIIKNHIINFNDLGKYFEQLEQNEIRYLNFTSHINETKFDSDPGLYHCHNYYSLNIIKYNEDESEWFDSYYCIIIEQIKNTNKVNVYATWCDQSGYVASNNIISLIKNPILLTENNALLLFDMINDIYMDLERKDGDDDEIYDIVREYSNDYLNDWEY